MYIDINSYGHADKIYITVNHYSQNGNIAIGMITENYEPRAILTKNLGEKLEENCAYVDTNNLPEIEEIIRKYHLAEPTGRQYQSGYCTYPEYRFNMNELLKYKID